MGGYKRYLALAGGIALIVLALALHSRKAIALSDQTVHCVAGKDLGRFVTAGVLQGKTAQNMYMVFEDKAGKITIVEDCNGFLWSVKRIEGSSVGVPE